VTAAVNGLSPSTQYFYRIRGTNGTLTGGQLERHLAHDAADRPGTPTATAATLITTTSFTANWTAVGGSTGYQLDVANDVAFSSFVTGFNNLAVAGTSQSVTGLISGSTYYFRVRAVNAGGPSGNSNVITTSTIPPAPTAAAATNLSTTGFSANWSGAAGATSYALDVATDNLFTAFVPAYNNFNVGNVLTWAVTGLSPNTPIITVSAPS